MNPPSDTWYDNYLAINGQYMSPISERRDNKAFGARFYLARHPDLFADCLPALDRFRESRVKAVYPRL